MCWSTKVPASLCSFRNALPWDNFAYKITANSIINTNKYNGIKYKSTCDSNGYTWWQKPSLNKYHIASFIQLNTNTKNRTMPHYDDNERWLPDGKSHHLDRKAKRLRLHPVLHLSQHCMINVMHIWQAWCIFDKYDAFYQNFSLQIYNRIDIFHSCPICVTFDWLSIRAWPVCIRRTSRDSVLWCHPRQYSDQP